MAMEQVDLQPTGMSQAELVRTITAAIMAAQATAPSVNGNDLGKTISDAIQAGMAANAPVRKVSFGEYQKRAHTPFSDGSVKLTRECFQWGHALRADALTNREITLLNKIDRSGRYINRMVEVVVNQEGADETVMIRWKCATPDDRMAIAPYIQSFEHCLEQIVAAQVAEDSEDVVNAESYIQKRRAFGDTKTMREALARRAAKEEAKA